MNVLKILRDIQSKVYSVFEYCLWIEKTLAGFIRNLILAYNLVMHNTTKILFTKENCFP